VNEREYMSAQEVAAYFGVSTDWVYERAAAGELPSYKFGGHRRFRRSELDAWAEAQREGQAPPPAENLGPCEENRAPAAADALATRALSG
jgi:excisionase family DNA binding protein